MLCAVPGNEASATTYKYLGANADGLIIWVVQQRRELSGTTIVSIAQAGF